MIVEFQIALGLGASLALAERLHAALDVCKEQALDALVDRARWSGESGTGGRKRRSGVDPSSWRCINSPLFFPLLNGRHGYQSLGALGSLNG